MAVGSIVCRVRLTCNLDVDVDGSTINLAPAVGRDWTPETALTTGTGNYQFDDFAQNRGLAIASAATTDFDLYGGSNFESPTATGYNLAGVTWAAAELVALWVINHKSSAGNILVGGAGANALTGPFNGSTSATIGPFGPGSTCFLSNFKDGGWTIGASNKLLRVAASGGDVTIDIFAAIRKT